MGLLASIVAYLSVVAAIVVGFLLSADALLYHSRHLATDPRPQITAAVKADSLKTKKIAKPSRKAAELRAIPKRVRPQSIVEKRSFQTRAASRISGLPRKRSGDMG